MGDADFGGKRPERRADGQSGNRDLTRSSAAGRSDSRTKTASFDQLSASNGACQASVNGALTIDSWHLFRGAGTLDEVAQLPPGLIGCVQLSDAPTRPLADPLEETTRARLSPGMGQLDIVGLIRALDAAGSLAPIAVEVFNKANRTQPFTELASGWASAARAVLDRARPVPSDPKLAMAITTA